MFMFCFGLWLRYLESGVAPGEAAPNVEEFKSDLLLPSRLESLSFLFELSRLAYFRLLLSEGLLGILVNN